MVSQCLLVSMGGIETDTNFGLIVIMGAQGLCKPLVGVRSPVGPPRFPPISEMVSPVLWEHVAQVRFLHRRPVLE